MARRMNLYLDENAANNDESGNYIGSQARSY